MLLRLLWNEHVINLVTEETDIQEIKNLYSRTLFSAVSKIHNGDVEFLMNYKLMFEVGLYKSEAGQITLQNCIDFVDDMIQEAD